KASFLANMSHEVRTPMIGILGYSELLNEEIEDEELKGMAASIHKSATRLLETLNLILDLSKIEAEKMTIVNRKIDLKELTSDVIESFLISAKNKGLYLELISETDDLVIHSDDRIIGQILNNLINNAIKFTFNGGIRLHLSKKIKNGFDYAVIKCSDTGIGIPEDKQFFIWDEFRQVSEGIGRNFEGTGLGLTLTKKFVAKIDGEISVESEVNKGTTFTVVIPFGKFDPALKEFMEQISLDKVQAPIDEKNTSKNVPHILYVEDDEIAYEIVSNYIKGLGELDWAQDAESAIQKIVQKNYDLILMDINLRKGLDGVQLTQVIRSQKNYTNTPVIAVTAYAMKGDREIFIEQGLTDYISKPFVKGDLVETVKKYLTS
ncbi:MAG: response regulator, partial [Ignavibacteriaceae bacterium]|nr:response regulator [Ignavibacteriaceae bacterium]